jgi:hypothetical protein
MTAPDPLGFLLGYLLENVEGTVLDGVPLRGGNTEPGDEPPMVLLEEAGHLRDRSVPWQSVRINVRAFGPLGPAGPRLSSELYRAVAELTHGVGPTTRSGVAVARMFEETGPQPAEDPDTRWPETFGVIVLEMADRVLT